MTQSITMKTARREPRGMSTPSQSVFHREGWVKPSSARMLDGEATSFLMSSSSYISVSYAAFCCVPPGRRHHLPFRIADGNGFVAGVPPELPVSESI